MTDNLTKIKSTIGPVLAEGIAATVFAQPDDPVSFLGNWLLSRESVSQQLEQQAEFRKSVDSARIEVAERRKQEAEEEARRIEEERIAKHEAHVESLELSCSSALTDVNNLDSSYRQQLLEEEEPHPDVFRVIRCILYITSMLPSQVPPSWNVAKVLLTDHVIDSLESLSLEPSSTALINRTRSIMDLCSSSYDEEENPLNEFFLSLSAFVSRWLSLQEVYQQDGLLKEEGDDEVDFELVVEEKEPSDNDDE
ncbi:hypothetical protein GEMRC1_011671 [Eukaryota sp. GEM-RC1]